MLDTILQCIVKLLGCPGYVPKIIFDFLYINNLFNYSIKIFENF